MKKLFSILMATMMIAGVSATAMADDTVNSVSLGNDASSGIALEGALLKPGETYKFPVSVTIGGETAALSEEILDDYNFRVSNSGEGKTVSTFELVRTSGVYYLKVTAAAGWPASSTEESYKIKLSQKKANSNSAELTVSFSTGYAEAEDKVIHSLSAGDKVAVDNNHPVYTKDQLSDIAELNNGRKVTFTGKGWEFMTSLSGQGAVNLLNNTNDVDEILEKYEENSFRFVTFPAGPKFRTSGSLVIDVEDYAVDFNETFYVYRYLDGKLTALSSSYDSFEETLTVKTDTLGRFVITDKAIADTTVVENGGQSSGSGTNNPGTGAAA